MMSTDDSVQQMLEDAKRRYLGHLEEQIAQAVALARAASSGEVGARDQLEKLVHRVRGTAGSYGIGAVSEAMGTAEDQLRAASSGEIDWVKLLALLQSVARPPG